MSLGEEVEDEEVDEEEKRRRALHSFQVKEAQRSREDLVTRWREVSKPRRAGAVARQPRGSKLDFEGLFELWLEARGLGASSTLERIDDQKGWAVYRYVKDPVVIEQPSWEVAFHGTWWYSLWMVLESGVFLESDDRQKGHDFWEPGVYCSPNLETARWYARPQVLFADGVFHRIIFELRVDPERRKKNRQRGGVQWVFPTAAVSLHAVWVQRNAPPANGEERVYGWEPELEALPLNRSALEPTVNGRNVETEPWPDPEDGDDSCTEDFPLAPHLHSSNATQATSSTSCDPPKHEPAWLPAARPSIYSRLRLGQPDPPPQWAAASPYVRLQVPEAAQGWPGQAGQWPLQGNGGGSQRFWDGAAPPAWKSPEVARPSQAPHIAPVQGKGPAQKKKQKKKAAWEKKEEKKDAIDNFHDFADAMLAELDDSSSSEGDGEEPASKRLRAK